MKLVTDRTASDVLLGNEKGSYGYVDLNRVEQAVSEISALFPILDINENLETKTDWGIPGPFSPASWPTESQMRRYLGNVAAIRNAFRLSISIPASMDRLNRTGANNIERTLEAAMKRAENTIQAFRYSGEVFAGEE